MVWQFRGELGAGSWRRATLSLTTIGVAFAVGLIATIGRLVLVHP
jgi:hypothetical protein